MGARMRPASVMYLLYRHGCGGAQCSKTATWRGVLLPAGIQLRPLERAIRVRDETAPAGRSPAALRSVAICSRAKCGHLLQCWWSRSPRTTSSLNALIAGSQLTIVNDTRRSSQC